MSDLEYLTIEVAKPNGNFERQIEGAYFIV